MTSSTGPLAAIQMQAVPDDAEPAMRFTREALPLRPYLQRVAYRYTRSRIDAEDLVQETYLRAWAGFGTYEAGTNIRAWLVRILVNVWMTNHRRSARRVQETLIGCLSEESAAHPLPVTPSAEDVVLWHHPDEVVKQCLAVLPMSYRVAIYYVDICQYPLKDVAAIEGIPLGTAMSRRHRGLRRLRVHLAANGVHGTAAIADAQADVG